MATRKLTATFQWSDGSPRKGSVSFAPNVWLGSSVEDVTVSVEPLRAKLNANGKINVTLMTTDTEGVTPVGWSYTVMEHLEGSGLRAYNIMVPAGKSTLDLFDLTDIVRV